MFTNVSALYSNKYQTPCEIINFGSTRKKKKKKHIRVDSLQPLLDEMREKTVALGVTPPVTPDMKLPMALKSYFDLYYNMATINDLTGLSNRRKFDIDFQQAFKSSKETGKPMSLAIIDLDYFKSQVDLFGHAYASGLVKRVGQILNEDFSDNNNITPYIYGGEEFCIIFKDIPAKSIGKTKGADKFLKGVLTKIKTDEQFQQKSREYKEKLTSEIEKISALPERTADENYQLAKCKAWKLHYEKNNGFTASAALANAAKFPEEDTPEKFFMLVDNTLDRAKKSKGRNCFLIADEPDDKIE